MLHFKNGFRLKAFTSVGELLRRTLVRGSQRMSMQHAVESSVARHASAMFHEHDALRFIPGRESQQTEPDVDDEDPLLMSYRRELAKWEGLLKSLVCHAGARRRHQEQVQKVCGRFPVPPPSFVLLGRVLQTDS